MAKLLEDELKVESKSDKVENDQEKEKDIGDTKFSLKKKVKGLLRKKKSKKYFKEKTS